MEYCAPRCPPTSRSRVSGYHIREAGSTAAQELAYTLADGFAYVELGLSRGLDVNQFAPGLSFFFDAHIDFFEEIAKFRAARRIWARWLRDVYGATSERAQWLRFHTQTAGVSLTAQQPYNNVVRTAVEALAAILGGTNSLHTNALDEVLALPSSQAAEIALRTQLVLLEETGVADVADPLGGSWYVEALTDRIEAQAEAIFDQIRGLAADGTMTAGILRGIETGYFTGEIAEAAFTYQRAVEKGDKRVVGVNVATDSVEQPLEILRVAGVRRADPGPRTRRATYGSRPSRRLRRARRHRSRRQVGREPGRADARCVPGRSHPRRDLRRPAHGVGHLHRDRQLLTCSPGQVQGGSGSRSSIRPPGRIRRRRRRRTCGDRRSPSRPAPGPAPPPARTEQLGHPGVPLDRGTLRARLGRDPRHVHRLVGEDVHRKDLVGVRMRLRGVQVGRRSWHGPCLISVLCSGTPSESYFTKPSSQPASTNASPAVWQCTDTSVPMSFEAADARCRCSRRRSTPGRATSSAGTSRSASATAGNRFGRPSASVRCKPQRNARAKAPQSRIWASASSTSTPSRPANPPQWIGRFRPRLVRRTSVPGPTYA